MITVSPTQWGEHSGEHTTDCSAFILESKVRGLLRVLPLADPSTDMTVDDQFLS